MSESKLILDGCYLTSSEPSTKAAVWKTILASASQTFCLHPKPTHISKEYLHVLLPTFTMFINFSFNRFSANATQNITLIYRECIHIERVIYQLYACVFRLFKSYLAAEILTFTHMYPQLWMMGHKMGALWIQFYKTYSGKIGLSHQHPLLFKGSSSDDMSGKNILLDLDFKELSFSMTVYETDWLPQRHCELSTVLAPYY